MSGLELIIFPIVVVVVSFAILVVTLWYIRKPQKRDIFDDEGAAEMNRRLGEEFRRGSEGFLINNRANDNFA